MLFSHSSQICLNLRLYKASFERFRPK
jgi:hypothetical protein